MSMNWAAPLRRVLAVLALAAALSGGSAGPVQAQVNRNWAPGFTGLSPDAKVVVAPIDVELFVVSAGGMLEPKADWTASAQRHMKAALQQRAKALGSGAMEMSEGQADQFAEQISLHGAVARAISLHHVGPWKLPTKEDKLDWTFGDTLRPIQTATGARYGLFTWVRDSYASPERVAMMVGLALVGIGVGGGVQVGYATLVDLETGQVLWFNQMVRGFGDLREAEKARESVTALLAGLPNPSAR